MVYENLIDLTNDPDVIAPLVWLRQREIVHFARFNVGTFPVVHGVNSASWELGWIESVQVY